MAETDGVLALGDVVEDLELLLRDALLERQSCDSPDIRRETYALGEVHLHGEDTDILRARRRLDILAGGSVESDGHAGWCR